MFEHCSSQCFINVDLDTLYLHIINFVTYGKMMIISNLHAGQIFFPVPLIYHAPCHDNR